MLQVILEGIRGDGIRGDIAVDDISLTPGCSLLIGPLPAAGTSVTPGMHLLSWRVQCLAGTQFTINIINFIKHKT